jgi:heptosyltransferase-3
VTDRKGRILIIRGGTLGEFILTCPVFSALREQFPQTELEILGYPRIAQLAKAAGLVDEVRTIESRAAAGFFARNTPLDEELAEYFARFSVIFSYLYDPDRFFQTNVARVSSAQFIVGPARPDEGKAIHATDAFLKPLEKLAIFGADSAPRLNFSGEAQSDSTIAIHASGDFQHPRNWSELRWRALLEAILARTSYRILLIAGDGEVRQAEQLARKIPPDRLSVSKGASLSDLAGQLASCHAFIGQDSGITHLAAATGVPCIVLWGSANEAIWGPRGKNVTVLKSRAGSVGVTQEEILAALPMIWSGAE